MDEPRSMIAMTKLTAELAETLTDMRVKFYAATGSTHTKIEAAMRDSELGSRTYSALCAAEQALTEAAEALMFVPAEMRNAGVPVSAEW